MWPGGKAWHSQPSICFVEFQVWGPRDPIMRRSVAFCKITKCRCLWFQMLLRRFSFLPSQELSSAAIQWCKVATKTGSLWCKVSSWENWELNCIVGVRIECLKKNKLRYSISRTGRKRWQLFSRKFSLLSNWELFEYVLRMSLTWCG